MKQPLWQRLRRERGSEGEPDTTGEAPSAPRPDPREVRARLRDLGGPRSSSTPPSAAGPRGDRQAAYDAWAARVRSHKQQKLADLGPEPAGSETDAQGPTASEPGAYWDSDTLFEESRRLEASRDPAVMGERELLAELGLSESASASDIQAAYRRLAKEHHPDRWVHADEDLKAHHARRMLEITAIYQALRGRAH